MPDSISIAPKATSIDSLVHHTPKVVEHLIIEEPDSLLGSSFVGAPAPLASHIVQPKVVAGQFPLPKDSTFLAHFRQLWPAPIRDITWSHEEIPWQPSGIAGDPTDYRFRNDDYVTSLLLLSFFIMTWVIASSWKFLRGQIHDFLYTRERPNLFTEREDNELRGRLLLVVQTCFLIALLFFTVTRASLPDVFAQLSPYVILSYASILSLIYFSAKLTLYNIVNHTFFPTTKCRQWNDTYLLSVLVTGCALLPITLLVVFFDMPPNYAIISCILLLSVIKILLLYKCYHIFFNSRLGSFHIILYLCTLEIIPLGIFAASLTVVSYRLLSI